ncbi:MAG: acyl-ACP--UDP-N-acetylglucosamine O-acyltransferase [Gammaproteobacteria bacterium]|nr:acyl-ACP--UDP-N-acetylglucosamine O-acyltransferase [Gammaproteobacteria bacterium]
MIDPTAFVHPSAEVGRGSKIGRHAYIGADVRIGEDCEIRPYATILGPTVLGDRNRVFQYATLGDEPQDISYQGEPTRLLIGHDNVFRENVTVHRGTLKGGGLTTIGSHNYLMVYSHVAHDCILGDHIMMVNYAGLSGHIEVADHVTIGGYCGGHHFVRIGAYAFLSHACLIVQDAPPFMMVTGGGEHPRVCGINSRGLQRNGFSSEEIIALKKLYKLYYRSTLSQAEALAQIQSEVVPICLPAQQFCDFISGSRRGVMR